MPLLVFCRYTACEHGMYSSAIYGWEAKARSCALR